MSKAESAARSGAAKGSSGGSAAAVALLVRSASGDYKTPLTPGRAYVLGRVTDCDVVIADASVSRQHARLVLGSTMTLEDLGSTNGTVVKGRTLAQGEAVAVTVGTTFELASVTVVLQGAQSADARAPGDARESEPAFPATIPRLVVSDGAMRNLHALLDVVAPTPLSLLVLGETGVGKEVYVEALHKRSSRASGPLVRLNCAALSESILEGELFGYEKGAFTGAVQAKPGLFEAADGGTMFLDEIGELPPSIQPKLLRVLESGHVQRLGSVKPRVVDVRFVSATHRDVRQLVAAGAFRSDLYFRLNGMTITIPPLRSRRGEIAPLARHFAAQATTNLYGRAVGLEGDALRRLERYDWPGNVRELRNVVERAAVLCRGERIASEHVSIEELLVVSDDAARSSRSTPDASDLSATPDPGALGLRAEMKSLERHRIIDALAKTGGNQSGAARLLSMSRFTLMKRIEEFGLARPRKRR